MKEFTSLVIVYDKNLTDFENLAKNSTAVLDKVSRLINNTSILQREVQEVLSNLRKEQTMSTEEFHLIAKVSLETLHKANELYEATFNLYNEVHLINENVAVNEVELKIKAIVDHDDAVRQRLIDENKMQIENFTTNTNRAESLRNG